MITSKEAQYLTEVISTEQLLINKFGAYSEQAQDASVKQICKDIQNAHRQYVSAISKQVGL